MKNKMLLLALIVFSGFLFFLTQFFWYMIFGSYGWLGGIIIGIVAGAYSLKKASFNVKNLYFVALCAVIIFILALILLDAFFLFNEKAGIAGFFAPNGKEFDLSLSGYLKYLFFKMPVISRPFILLTLSFTLVHLWRQLRRKSSKNLE